MPAEPYNIDDLFPDHDTSHLERDRQGDTEESLRNSSQDSDINPLMLIELEQIPEDEQEIALKKEIKDRRKYEQEETSYIQKEIKEAHAEIRKLYNYKDLSPRQLYAMIRFYQEEALVGKTAGILSHNHPGVLLMPMIENDGERDFVVLRPPIIGALERHQILSSNETIELVKDYYRLNHC